MEKIKELLDKLFKDKKKRHLWTAVVIIPLLIVIGICGFNIYKQVKNMISMVDGDTNAADIDEKFIVHNGSDAYVLRENYTDFQNDCFKELKKSYEDGDDSEENWKENAKLVVNNFVVDFYTWTNKYGQYDVGGLTYVYSHQKKAIYLQARDQFYKYINQYINKYGSDALLEVDSVNSSIEGSKFLIDNPDYEEDDPDDEKTFEAYKVTANWTYAQKDGGFDTSKYDTKAYFVVIKNGTRLEIAYTGSKPYEKIEIEDETSETEEVETNETEE